MKNPDVLWFFQRKPHALSLYERLEDMALEAAGEMEVRVQKTQISFYRRHMFACVSMMPVPKALRRRNEYIVVTLGLGFCPNSPRVMACTQPHPGRQTIHVPVFDEEEIDAQLLEWMQEACAYSEARR